MKKILLLVVLVLFLLCGSNIITYYITNQKIQVQKTDLASVTEHQPLATIENNNLNRGKDLNNFNIETKEKERHELLTFVNSISSDQYWDETIMNNISEGPIFDEGFMSKPSNKKLILQILNTTEEDIQNVSVKFTITTFKQYITFGIDKLDIVAYQPRPYKEVTNNIRIENIKSNELVELDIFYMATFPQVKVEIESINITENCVITEPLIYYYCSDEFESIGDIQDLRKLLGITYIDTTIEENDSIQDTIELDDRMENKEKIIEELKLLNSKLIQENEEYQKVIDDLEKSTDYVHDTEGRQIRIVGYSNGFVKYMLKKEEHSTYLTHTIIGYNQGFNDVGNIEVLDFSRNGPATIKFKVFGSMYNFKISTIIWDTNYKDYVEDQIICEMNEVRNQDIMFDSVLAEGMPNELLTWTDEDGNEFSLLIGDDNLYGFSGSIIICDLYDR